jgi:hypothetical protein
VRVASTRQPAGCATGPRWSPGLRDPHHWLAILHYMRGQDESAVSEVRLVMELAKAHAQFRARFDALPPGPAMAFYLRG